MTVRKRKVTEHYVPRLRREMEFCDILSELQDYQECYVN